MVVRVLWVGLLAWATAAELYDSSLHEAVIDAELCDQHLSEISSFSLYDFSFRVPQSVLQGNAISWGNFHNCLGIGRHAGAEANVPRGKYCLLYLTEASLTLPNIPQLPWPALAELPWRELNTTWTEEKIAQHRRMKNVLRLYTGLQDERGSLPTLMQPLQLGVCIPETCTPRQALEPYLHNAVLNTQYTEVCRLPGDRPYHPADYAALVVFSLIGILTLLSTGYELYQLFVKKDIKLAKSAWAIFSLYGNGKQVLSVPERGPSVIKCLDGIRSISILWVILGHSAIKMAIGNLYNLLDTFRWMESPAALYITSANICVDTFFFMSGLLIVYTAANKTTSKMLISNLHLFYLNRILRMFPLLATAVLLQAGPMHRISDGANWEVESLQVQYCREKWWAALLHIQNYYAPMTECLHHTWYLSVDVQLHILSPLVLVWLLGSRRGAQLGAISGAVISLAASVIFCFIMNMDASLSLDSVEDDRYFNWFYVNTLTRAPVFFIGMAYGYLLHEFRKTRLHIPKVMVCLLWLASAAVASGVLYVFYLTATSSSGSQILDNFINSFHRPSFAVALGWLIVACVHGYAGPINWFLSLQAWQFISKLSYAMYIFHYPMQFAFGAAAFAPMYFSVGRLWINFVTDLSLTIFISIFFSITIDTPFSTLIRMALSKRPVKPKASSEDPKGEKETNEIVVVDKARL